MWSNLCVSINKNSRNIKVLKHTNNYLRNKKIFLAVVGNIYNLEYNKISLEEIESLYYEYNKEIVNYIDGIYSLFIFDYELKEFFVFQDDFGANQAIYYYEDEAKIIISNQLKEILIREKKNWAIDKYAVKEFIEFGFILSSRTLINQIKKIPSREYLHISFNNFKIKLKKKNMLKRSKGKVDTQIYNNTVKQICENSIQQFNNNISISISSGYDTNYLLYNIKKVSKKNVKVFCVGGKTGVNEIPTAQKICNNYNNLDFFSSLVDEKSIEKYPEIIWAYEGILYERGIFLEYEVSKLLSTHNVESVILGEGADQILNYDLYSPHFSKMKKLKHNFLRKVAFLFLRKLYRPYNDAYEMLSSIVLKKNGVMLNYYNVNTISPYMSKKFINVASAVVIKGDRKKQYHKRVIKEVMPQEITRFLNKIGGATEQSTLFKGNITLEKLRKICEKTEFYKNYSFIDEKYEMDYILKILYIEIFKKIFLSKNIKKYYENGFDKYDIKYFFQS